MLPMLGTKGGLNPYCMELEPWKKLGIIPAETFFSE
jgi:hypothetical protein